MFPFTAYVADQELMCKMPVDIQLFITQLWMGIGMVLSILLENIMQ